jgi:aromatic ring hydroxylase
MYADYSFYSGEYLGSVISEADFPRLSLRASKFLDYYTMNRAKDYGKDDALKHACCAVAEAYHIVEESEAKRGIASESVGSYSVSYREDRDVNKLLAESAKPFLAFTGLLYRGGC